MTQTATETKEHGIMLMHICKCGAKFSNAVLQKTHILGKGFFCPSCGMKKDGRSWKETKERF